jgi:hypothetical protein
MRDYRVAPAKAWLVNEYGKTKAGRGKAAPPGYFTPKTHCAATVLEAWSLVHGVEPASRNLKIAFAAHLLWTQSVSLEETKRAVEWIRAGDFKIGWGRTSWRGGISPRCLPDSNRG